VSKPVAESSAVWEGVGGVAAVFEALATFGAFAIAGFLLWQTLRDRRIAQARLVSGWLIGLDYTRLLVEGKTHSIKTGYPLLTDLRRAKSEQLGIPSSIAITQPTHLVDFVVENGSEETITEVSVRFFRKRRDQHLQYFHTRILELPPQHRHEDFALLPANGPDGKEVLKHTRGLKVQLIFTDASGRRWERVTGQPVEFRKRKDLVGSNLKWEHVLAPSPKRVPSVGSRVGGEPRSG